MNEHSERHARDTRAKWAVEHVTQLRCWKVMSFGGFERQGIEPSAALVINAYLAFEDATHQDVDYTCIARPADTFW